MRIPISGDKIIITDYEGFPSNEAVRLAKLPYLTVESVLPIPLTDEDGSNRRTAYEVYVNETGYCVGISWKFHEDDE